MISNLYYYTKDENEAIEPQLSVGEVTDIVVPIRGRLLYSLKPSDDLIYNIMATPNTIIETVDQNTVLLKNAYVESCSALGPSVLEDIISMDNENVYCRNGIILDWAFEHHFRSTIIFYMHKYPTLRKHIERLIFANLTRSDRTDMLIEIIDRYEYDVHKNNNILFTQSAMSKNVKLCEYLLYEKDCLIPVNVYNIFRQHGNKKFPTMWELLSKNVDKIDWR